MHTQTLPKLCIAYGSAALAVTISVIAWGMAMEHAETYRVATEQQLQEEAMEAQSKLHTAAPEIQNSELALWGLTPAYTLSVPSQSLVVPVLRASKTFLEAKEWKDYHNQMRIAMNYGVVLYPNSAPLGELGVSILGGRSIPLDGEEPQPFDSVFAGIEAIQIGETIAIQQEESTFRYIVTTVGFHKDPRAPLVTAQCGSQRIAMLTWLRTPEGVLQYRVIAERVEE